MTKENKKNILSMSIAMILLSIVAGALSGVSAAVFTNRSLERYFEYLSQDDGLVRLSAVKPRPVPGTYEEALDRVTEQGWPSTAVLRTKTDVADLRDDWQDNIAALGFGAVVTNDGWILFSGESLAFIDDPIESAEIWVKDKKYPIIQVVPDELTGFVLVKVDAHDLSAFAFGNSAQTRGGEMVFQLSGSSGVTALSLVDTEVVVASIINPAEVFETYWQLSQEGVAGPLINSSGELIGLAVGGNQALPLHQAVAFVQAVLRTGQPEHAAVGAYAVDLDAVLNVDEKLTNGVSAGALLTAPKNRKSAIVSGGPAALAGLQDGDIILSVDRVLIIDNVSLAEILTNYRPGNQATFNILRQGETLEVIVTFANYADLIY